MLSPSDSKITEAVLVLTHILKSWTVNKHSNKRSNPCVEVKVSAFTQEMYNSILSLCIIFPESVSHLMIVSLLHRSRYSNKIFIQFDPEHYCCSSIRLSCLWLCLIWIFVWIPIWISQLYFTIDHKHVIMFSCAMRTLHITYFHLLSTFFCILTFQVFLN